jgi:SsrA-binding protein
MAQPTKQVTQLNIKNRKASFEYQLLMQLTAGIMLTGTEIKSIRAGKANIADAYCTFVKEELYVRNMHIQEYEMGNIFNHEPKRDRKLLLNKTELSKLRGKMKDKGFTIVPLQMFLSESGFAKLEIALARGKKLYDKRESLKDKDVQRDMARRDID